MTGNRILLDEQSSTINEFSSPDATVANGSAGKNR